MSHFCEIHGIVHSTRCPYCDAGDNSRVESELVHKVCELQQIIIGQQRLIEMLERKIQAAENAANESLALATYPPMRLAIQTIIDAIEGAAAP